MKRQNIALELFQRLINKERDRPKIFKTEREGPKPLETSLKVKTPITHPTYFVLPYPNIILYIYFLKHYIINSKSEAYEGISTTKQ